MPVLGNPLRDGERHAAARVGARARYSFDQFLSARSAWGPTVDPAGDRIYFVSDIAGSPQLWSLPLDGPTAWPEPIAVGFDRVQYAHPSGRPRRLIVAADRGGNERTQLYLLDGLGTIPRQITAAEDAIHMFGGWAPDARTIAFSSNERDPRFFDIYTLDVESGRRRLLFQGDGTFYVGPFSPDGRSLAVQQVHSPCDHSLFALDVASGTARPLTERGPATRYQRLAWSADGQSILSVSDRGRDFLQIASVDVADGRFSSVVEADWDIDDFALSSDGRRIAYEVNADGFSLIRVRDLLNQREVTVDVPRGQAFESHKWFPTVSWCLDDRRFVLSVGTATSTANIYVADADAGTAARLTTSWSAGLDFEALAPAELFRYPSFDGREIPAFIFRPRDGRDDRSRPALFYVHGGPESQIRALYNPTIQYFAHRGYTVIAPNVRGSSGYGNEYVHLDDVERRMDSVRDLAAGAEWVVRSGLAAPGRIAVMGGSYGGFMVLASLTSYPDLWAAGVDIVGIANFVTFLERTGPWRRHLREAEYGSLERNRAFLEEISPIHKVDRIVAPLMVIHGANDPRVPINEAEQIVAALEARGRPVEYLRFEDEGHGLAKLRNRLVAYPRVAEFLDRHLGAPAD